jgi:hypothetical protein
MDLHPDFKDLWAEFARCGVRRPQDLADVAMLERVRRLAAIPERDS